MKRKKITAILLSYVLATSMFQVVSTQKTYAANESVSVWLTKADQSQLLVPQTNVAFSEDSGTNNHTINVNENITYQQMDGFGASITDSSASLINNLSTAARDTLMTKLFDKTNGIGISLLRQTIGSCDYSLNQYSYDEMSSGQTDSNLNNFSISHDNAYIVPVLQQALQKNSNIKIIATPWSPPGWMKSGGSMIGGTLNTSAYTAYANYFVKYINAYAAQGLPIYAVTLQNEPEYSPSNYPGMLMSASEEANFIKNNLGPTFATNNIATKIIAYDHNFDDINYPLSVLGDSGANPYVAGTGWHIYAGQGYAMTPVHNAYPTKDNWFTEGSGGSWVGNGSWHDNFNDRMKTAIRVTRNWSKSVLWWNMALDENNGPSVLPSSTCYGAVTINQSTGAVSYNADYYTLGQFSKYVDPGAYRLESNSFDNDVEDVAFKNPDGSKALIVNNKNRNDGSVKVKWGSESFTYTLPADSAITFKWSGSQSGSQITPNPVWYQNFETGSGFTAGTNATVASDSSSANSGGSKSVKLTTSVSSDPGSSAQCVNVVPPNITPVDVSSYSYLNFNVKDTTGGTANTVKVTFVDKNNAVYSTWTTTKAVPNQWTPISFELSSITGIDTTAIKEIRVGEWNTGVYYFDDFSLAADTKFILPAYSSWYQNFELGNGFTAGTSATVAIDSSSANTGGLKSARLTTSVSGDPGSTVQCVNVIPQIGTSFDASTYGYLNFYVKDTQGANTIKLTFVDTSNAVASVWTTASSVQNSWTKISYPLSSVSGINVKAIKEIRVGEWNAGVYYLDDFNLSANSTNTIPQYSVWYQNLETGIGYTSGTSATVAIDSSSANTGGSKSVKLTTSVSGDPGSTAQCVKLVPQSGTSFDVTSYGYLNFYVKDTQGANTLKLTFVDTNNTVYSTWTTGSSVQNTWTKISFPTSSITGINTAAIKEIRVGEWNTGVYNFDDFYFSPGSTFSVPSF